MEDFDPRESVVLQYGEMIYGIALHSVLRKEDAEDVYSEVFLRYFRSEPRFESEEHRKAWLIRVTLNCATDVLRARHDGVELNEELAIEAPAPDRDACLDLRDAVERLPLPLREVVELFYLQELPIRQIALILDTNENTVKSRLRASRERLKKYLTEG